MKNQYKLSFWLNPKGGAAIGLIASATYFLVIEHRQHLFEYLPYIILLMCPLMHFVMHRGDGSHSGEKHGSEPHK
ncbi:DUF2933 domain-containing protein [Teredinibacter turnerae]|uniref:DUF2933 domain-containing protein n=1 Tax=Teredinibacter turnerae TaxID=2426 RepID=UPI00055F1812|nr:DUF2933 domain-containing protein [Teredinibacter turnerae]